MRETRRFPFIGTRRPACRRGGAATAFLSCLPDKWYHGFDRRNVTKRRRQQRVVRSIIRSGRWCGARSPTCDTGGGSHSVAHHRSDWCATDAESGTEALVELSARPGKVLNLWRHVLTRTYGDATGADLAAWLLSLSFHLALLVVLAAIGIYIPKSQVTLEATLVRTEPEELPREFIVSNTPDDAVGAQSFGGDAAAMAAAAELSDFTDIQPETPPQDVTPAELHEFLEVSHAPYLSDTLTLRGEAGMAVNGAMGAIDRITREVLLSLEQRPTLLVWLFDQSGSLDAIRQTIYDRFDRIYKELGIIEQSRAETVAAHRRPLLSAIVAFGQQVSFRTERPTDDVDKLKQALAGIDIDPSGVEMVFSAVISAAERYRRLRTSSPRRNLMFIIVSDEVGDDEARAEEAVTICRKLSIPVYVIGVPAPFGRQEALVKYVDPDPKYDQSVQWIPVRQGPESAMPERLKLAFSASPRAQELEQIDSGFGPFHLTRLCYATGGIYFILHPNKATPGRRVNRREVPVMSAQLYYFFDQERMRRYRPDYVSLFEYQRRLKANRARAALVEASAMSRISPLENPRRRFPKQDDASLKRLLDQAQQAAAKLEPKLESLYRILKSGEADRPKLRKPRWMAGFDLAMGRVLAAKVRTEGYNAMLAELKQGRPFKDAKNDTWVLVPADTIETDSRLDRMVRQARQYLEGVISQHPGTPWELLAKEELAQPLGWKWTETFTGVNAPRQRQPGNNNPLPRNDRRRMAPKEPQRPRRQIRL